MKNSKFFPMIKDISKNVFRNKKKTAYINNLHYETNEIVLNIYMLIVLN